MRLLEQLLIHNSCYAAGKVLDPDGVMIHSTGANNPNVSRYVPGNDEIGFNTAGNHWDQSNAQWQAKFGTNLNKCVHAFIGKTADGSVATVQTLPFTMRGWHAGDGEGNDHYIGFEICEDGLDDPEYFAAVYREAVEFVTHLCRLRGWDPLEDGVVICHAEGYRRGIASNHGDVLHWFPKHGKSMDDFRADVARELEGEDDMSYEKFVEYMKRYEEEKAAQPASEWAKAGLEQAKARGITDGKRPQSYATRQEVALMVRSAVYAQ